MLKFKQSLKQPKYICSEMALISLGIRKELWNPKCLIQALDVIKTVYWYLFRI